jgi:hypothetical protein
MELYTTKEIIEELSKRTTFAGIIIQSRKELKNDNPEIHGTWDITYCNLTPDNALKLLERTTQHFSGL